MKTSEAMRRGVGSFLLISSWMIAACGGGTQVEEESTTPVDVHHVEAPPRPTATSLLGADSFCLVEVDVTRARNSAYYDMVRSWVVFLIEEETGDEAPGLIQALDQAVQDVDKITASFVPRGSRYDLGSIVFEGRFEPGEVEGWMRLVMPDHVEEDLRRVEMGPYQGWTARDGALMEIDAGMYVLGPPDRLQGPLSNPAEPAAFSDAQFLAVQQQLNVAAPILRATVLGTPAGRHMLRYDSPLEGAAENAASAAVAFDATSGAELNALAILDTPETAIGWAERLGRERDALSNEMPLRMMPSVVAALQSVQIEARGEVASVDFRISDADLRPLLETLDGFLRMARGGGPGAP